MFYCGSPAKFRTLSASVELQIVSKYGNSAHGKPSNGLGTGSLQSKIDPTLLPFVTRYVA